MDAEDIGPCRRGAVIAGLNWPTELCRRCLPRSLMPPGRERNSSSSRKLSCLGILTSPLSIRRSLTGAEHIRLYDNAVVVPGPVTEAVAAMAKSHAIVVVLGVNERDHGTLYNAQLIFDADGRLILKRRKITPTFHERMIWGQGDGSGLKVVDTVVGRIGALACWEHYNPLARYALMAQHEEIHVAQFPGSMVGPIFAEQMEVDDPPSCSGKRLLRGQRHGLADRRADRENLARRKIPQGAARRLHDRDRLAGRRTSWSRR